MEKEKCSECNTELVLGEKGKCVYCELNHVKVNNALLRDTSCGKCNIFVLKEKGSLYCELCKRWYHNSCHEPSLDDQYCSLLYDSPKNIKWFCDKCIWDTEKWISEYTFNKECGYRTNVKANVKDTVHSDYEDVDDFHQENDIKSSIQKDKGDIKSNIQKDKGDLKSNIQKDKGDLKSNIQKDKGDLKSNIQKDTGDVAFNKNDDQIQKPEKRKRGRPKGSFKKSIMVKKKVKRIKNPDESGNEDGNETDSTFEADDPDPEFQPVESDTDSDFNIRKINKKSSLKPVRPKIKKELRKSEPKHQCPFCRKGRFRFRKTLVRHLKIHEEKECICPDCNGVFKSEEKLACHKKNVHAAKMFICEECGKTVKSHSHLIHHMRVHTGEKPYACTLCEFRTAAKGDLNKHLARHTGEKPHLCSTCGYRSYNAHSMRRHLRTHTGEKPYLCAICGKHFSSEKNLKEHVMIHTGDKPYSCNVCGYRCIQKGVLNRHMQTHSSKPHNLTSHKNGTHGTTHDDDTHKQKIQPIQKSKPSSDSNASDSNSNDSVPLKQNNQQPPPPLLIYAGATDKSVAPVYPSSHYTLPPTGRGGPGLYGGPSRLANPSSFFSYYSL